MEIRHLKMLKEVAECKNLTRASERLFLSQSALSHQLKELEDFFQAQLFIRQKRQMIPTRAGELLLEKGQYILNELEITKQEIRQITNKDFGEIRFSSECYTSYHWLSNILKEFYEVYPNVTIAIVMEATRNALNFLLENKIDVGIFEGQQSNRIVYTKLFTDEFYVVVAPDHRWAGFKTIDIDVLHQEPYIMYNIPVEQSTIFNLVFNKNYPPKVYALPLTEVIIEMVKAGIGFTIMPNWVVYKYIRSKELVAIKIRKVGIKRTWYAGVLKDKVTPPYVTAFIQKLARLIRTSEEHKLSSFTKCSAENKV